MRDAGADRDPPDCAAGRRRAEPRAATAHAAATGGDELEQVEAERVAAVLDRRAPDRVQERREHDESEFGVVTRARRASQRRGQARVDPRDRLRSSSGARLRSRPFCVASRSRLGVIAPGVARGALGSRALALRGPDQAAAAPARAVHGPPGLRHGGAAAGRRFGFAALVLLGIALAAASANTLNAYLERDVDALHGAHAQTARCRRGASRRARRCASGSRSASPRRRCSARSPGPRPRGLGVASILFYVFVYTIWLKPRSAWNAVIGGAAGAAAPLIADAAVNGQRRRRGPRALRDRVLLAAAARLGDRALSQGATTRPRASRCCRA